MILKMKSQHLNLQLQQVNLYQLFDFLIKSSRPFNVFSFQIITSLLKQFLCQVLLAKVRSSTLLCKGPSIHKWCCLYLCFLKLSFPLFHIFTKCSYKVSFIFRNCPSGWPHLCMVSNRFSIFNYRSFQLKQEERIPGFQMTHVMM